MIDDLFILMQWENYGHLFISLIISTLVIGITVYKVYFKEKIIEGNIFKKIGRAISGAAKSATKALDPTKFINSAITSVSDFFKDLFHAYVLEKMFSRYGGHQLYVVTCIHQFADKLRDFICCRRTTGTQQYVSFSIRGIK